MEASCQIRDSDERRGRDGRRKGKETVRSTYGVTNLCRIRTSDLQIVGKRCIHYASQDGPIHIQSGTGFMQLYRRYRAPPEVFMEMET